MTNNYHRNKSFNDKAWKVFTKEHPAMANKFMDKVKPSITNVSEIGRIWAIVKKADKFNDKSTEVIAFIATVIKLYSPATLEVSGVRVPFGIHGEINKCIGCGSISQVSQLVSQARAYMNITSFREKVETLTKEVKNGDQ